MLRIELHVIQNKLEQCQDCSLAGAGGEDCENINPIKQLHYGLNLIILQRVGPELLKNFMYEPLPPEEKEEVLVL